MVQIGRDNGAIKKVFPVYRAFALLSLRGIVIRLLCILSVPHFQRYFKCNVLCFAMTVLHFTVLNCVESVL